MLLSTAIPTVIAAMVIVIISRGRLMIPIRPSTSNADNRFGIIPIIISLKDLNSTRNITAITNITNPRDLICESNKLCSMLLYKRRMPVIETFSEFR